MINKKDETMVGKTEEVYGILKKKIISLEIAPRSEISDSLLTELNVSKTPFREAILALERDGFIKIYARKATIVTDITEELITQVYDVRLLLEPYIAKSCCGQYDLKIVREMKEAFLEYGNSNSHDIDYFINLDDKLHAFLIEPCTNVFVQRTMLSVTDHSARIRRHTSHRNRDYKQSTEQHVLILDAIERKSPDLIESAVRYHVLQGRRESMEYLYNEKPEE